MARRKKPYKFETKMMRQKRRKREIKLAAFAFGFTILAATATIFAWPERDRIAATFSPIPLCENSPVPNHCVVDGDTIHYQGETIRIADIDAPEIFSPQCQSELARGEIAKVRLQEMLNEGAITFERYGPDEDQYGRKLRVIRDRNGQSIGYRLVKEGHARSWNGSRQPWC